MAAILRKISAIAFFTVEKDEGDNKNNLETPTEYHANDCYRVACSTFSQRSAYAAHLHRCDSIFGSGMLMVDSSFCVRCHNCVKVTCSMDLDSCANCSRCYFCHNCENVHDSMFCFNVKNLKYAVGNYEVGREEFLRLKKLLLSEIARSLEKTGDYPRDVCSLV